MECERQYDCATFGRRTNQLYHVDGKRVCRECFDRIREVRRVARVQRTAAAVERRGY